MSTSREARLNDRGFRFGSAISLQEKKLRQCLVASARSVPSNSAAENSPAS